MIHVRFMATETDTWHMGVRSETGKRFDYRLEAVEFHPGPDTPGDASTTAVIARGESFAEMMLDDYADIDAIELDITPGDAFVIRISGDGRAPVDVRSLNAWASVFYETTCGFAPYVYCAGLNADSYMLGETRCKILTGVAGGAYVNSPRLLLSLDSGWPMGGYRVELLDVDDPEPNGIHLVDDGSPSAVADGPAYAGDIAYTGDVDVARLELGSEGVCRFVISGDGATPALARSIDDYSIRHVHYATDSYSGSYVTNARLGGWTFDTYPGEGADVVTLFLSAPRYGGELALGLSATRGDHRITVEDVTDDFPDEIRGDAYTEATLTPGAPVESAIDYATDHDWFAVEAEAGHDYRVRLVAPEGRRLPFGGTIDLREGLDALKLYSAYGGAAEAQVDYDRVHVTCTSYSSAFTYTRGVKTIYLAFEATSDGPLFVNVGDHGGDHPTYACQISLEDFGFEGDVPGGVDTPVLLAPEGTVHGVRQHVIDADWFGIDAPQGEKYMVRVSGDGASAVDAHGLYPGLVNQYSALGCTTYGLSYASHTFTRERYVPMYTSCSDSETRVGIFTTSGDAGRVHRLRRRPRRVPVRTGGGGRRLPRPPAIRGWRRGRITPARPTFSRIATCSRSRSRRASPTMC